MKKTLKIILIVILLISLLLILLIAYGKENGTTTKSQNNTETENTQANNDIDNEEYFATVQETLTEVLDSMEYFFNNGEIRILENYVDYNAATAYYLKESYQESEEKNIDFHELYNLINYIDQYGTSDAFAEYNDFITELNGESEEDLNDLITVRNNMQSYFEEFVEQYEEAENVQFEITSISDLKQLESNIYSIDIEYNYSGSFDGEEETEEESDTIYFMETEEEFYVIYSDDFNID